MRKSLDQYGDVLSPADVRSIMGLGHVSSYELCNSGQFPIVKVGRRIFVSKNKFREWLENGLGA